MSLLLRHLEANGSLPATDLEAATRHQRSAGGSLDTALLELGLVTPLQLDELLKAACGLPGAPVRLLERGPTRPWEHVPKDLVDIGWVIPLALDGGQIVAAVHPDLPDAKLGALYRQIRGFSPVVAPECCLAKVAAERSGAILSPRYAMLVLDYLQALRDRDAAADEPAPPAPRPLRGPSDTNPVRPASGKSPAARPAEAPRPLHAVPQDRSTGEAEAAPPPASPDRSVAPQAPVSPDRPASPVAPDGASTPPERAASAAPDAADSSSTSPPPAAAPAQDGAPAAPAAPAPAAPVLQDRPTVPSAVLPATALPDRPHLSAAAVPQDRRDTPAAPIRRRSGPSPAPTAAIPTAPTPGTPMTQAQRLAAARAALAGARERDRITEALVRAAVIVAPRVGLFGVKREGLRVLAAPTSALRLTEGLVIPLPEGGPLDRAVSGQSPLSLLTEPSLSFAVGQPLGIPCVFEPVLAGGRTVLMLYLDRAGVAFDPQERAALRELCDTARQSLESLLRLLGWVVPSGPPEPVPGDRSPPRPHLAQGVFIPPVPTNLAVKPPDPTPAPPATAKPSIVLPPPAAASLPVAAPPASTPPSQPAASEPAADADSAARPTEPRTAPLPAAPGEASRPTAAAPESTTRTVRSPYPGTLLARAPSELISPPHPTPTSDAPSELAESSPPTDAAEPTTPEPRDEPASDPPVARTTEVSSDHAAARLDPTSGDGPLTGRNRGARGSRGRAVITLVNPIRRDEAPPTPQVEELASATTSAREAFGPDSPLVARFAAFAAADDSPQPERDLAPRDEPPATDLEAPRDATVDVAPAQPAAHIPNLVTHSDASIVDIPDLVARPHSQASDAAPSKVDIPNLVARPTPAVTPSPAPSTRAPSQPLVAATIPPLTRPPAAPSHAPAEPLVATIPPLTRPPAPSAEPVATIPPLTQPPAPPSPAAAEPLVATIPPLTSPPAHLPSETGSQAQVASHLSEEPTPIASDAPAHPAEPATEPSPAPVSTDSSAAAEAAAPAPSDSPAAAPVPADIPAPSPQAEPSPDAASSGTRPSGEPAPSDSSAALHMPNLVAPAGARARRRAAEPAAEPVLVIPKTLRRSTTLTATPHPMARRAERDAPAETPPPAPAPAPAPTLSIPTSLINPRGGRRRGKNEPRPEAPPTLNMPRLVREADAAAPAEVAPTVTSAETPPPPAALEAPPPSTPAPTPEPAATAEATPPTEPPPPAATAEPTPPPATPPDEAAAPPERPAPADASPEPAPEALSAAPGPIEQVPEASPAPAPEPATHDDLPEHPTTDDEIDAVIEAFLHSPTDWNAGARLRALDVRGLARLAARFPGPIDLANATNFPPPSAHGPLLRACVELGQAIAPHILVLFGSPRPQIRFYAAFLFQELRDPRCLRPLGDLAFDADPDVRLIATRVLESYSRVPDFLAVAARIRAELDNRDRERQLLAAEAAGTLRDTFAVPRLIDLLAVRDNNLREAALEALCSITAKHHGYRAARWRSWYADHGDESRIEWVMDGLRHRDVAVRRWAADELVRITGQRIPFPVDGDRRSRDAALRLWQEWWDNNRDEFTRRP